MVVRRLERRSTPIQAYAHSRTTNFDVGSLSCSRIRYSRRPNVTRVEPVSQTFPRTASIFPLDRTSQIQQTVERVSCAKKDEYEVCGRRSY